MAVVGAAALTAQVAVPGAVVGDVSIKVRLVLFTRFNNILVKTDNCASEARRQGRNSNRQDWTGS